MELGSCLRRAWRNHVCSVVAGLLTLTEREVYVAGFHATHHCIDSTESWINSKDGCNQHSSCVPRASQAKCKRSVLLQNSDPYDALAHQHAAHTGCIYAVDAVLVPTGLQSG